MSVSGLILQEANLELGVSVRPAFSCHSLSLTCGAFALIASHGSRGGEAWRKIVRLLNLKILSVSGFFPGAPN